MHFSIESTPTLVEMYGNAIFQMQETSASDSESTSATPELRRAASVSPERQHPPASAPADANGERSRDLASRNEEQLVPRHNRGPGEAEDCISDDEEQVSSTQTPSKEARSWRRGLGGGTPVTFRFSVSSWRESMWCSSVGGRRRFVFWGFVCFVFCVLSILGVSVCVCVPFSVLPLDGLCYVPTGFRGLDHDQAVLRIPSRGTSFRVQ